MGVWFSAYYGGGRGYPVVEGDHSGAVESILWYIGGAQWWRGVSELITGGCIRKIGPHRRSAPSDYGKLCVLFLHLLETSETKVSIVFRGYKERILVWNGLIIFVHEPFVHCPNITKAVVPKDFSRLFQCLKKLYEGLNKAFITIFDAL